MAKVMYDMLSRLIQFIPRILLTQSNHITRKDHDMTPIEVKFNFNSLACRVKWIFLILWNLTFDYENKQFQ